MVPSRRTLVVLGSLLGAMTLISSLLLALEPGPVSPIGAVRLQALEPVNGQASRDPLATESSIQPGRWGAIVVHFSGTQAGSAATVNQLHERLGWGGLGYHFVLGNGQGSGDGQVEVGFRWRRQMPGAHSVGPDSGWYNSYGIGVCLVGDPQRQAPTQQQMLQLASLVQQLQERHGIPANRVYVASGPTAPDALPRTFPVAWFRQQLLASPVGVTAASPTP